MVTWDEKEGDNVASANWEKMKSSTEVKAVMRHCDQAERERGKHANKNIDKSKTSRNWSMQGLTYAEACQEYDRRIAELDAKPGSNKRKDRVTYVGIDIPVPEALPKDQLQPWFSRVWNIFQTRTGNAGIEGWVHVDEVHDYMRDGKVTTSREHIHIGAIPVVDGRLCAKEFTSRRNIMAFNTDIQRMSQDEFGVRWMDGSRQKSTETVESLKSKSLTELQAWERDLEQRERVINMREMSLDEREHDLNSREREVESRSDQVSKYVDRARSAAERVEKQAEIVDNIRERTRDDITPDWIDDGLPAAVRPFRSVLRRSYTEYKIDRAKEAAQQRQCVEEARKKAEAEQKALAEAEAAERRRREDAERRWQEREEREQKERKRRLEALAAKQEAEREARYRRYKRERDTISKQPEQEQSDDFDISL